MCAETLSGLDEKGVVSDVGAGRSNEVGAVPPARRRARSSCCARHDASPSAATSVVGV